MNEETLAALRKSIENHQHNSTVTNPYLAKMGIGDCPLCMLFYSGGCLGCPIMARTGASGCRKTPYATLSHAHWHWRYGRAWGEHTDEWQQKYQHAALEEVLFLKSLLPEDHDRQVQDPQAPVPGGE